MKYEIEIVSINMKGESPILIKNIERKYDNNKYIFPTSYNPPVYIYIY